MSLSFVKLRDALSQRIHEFESGRCFDLEITTCWDFPYQSPEGMKFGDNKFHGCTPALAIWNLLLRYTNPGDLVVDCMAGSGTTLDVSRALGRRAIGLDINPTRSGIFKNDARILPFGDDTVDFHFVDSPYSNNLHYSDEPDCIGKLSANDDRFFMEMSKVVSEVYRTLKPDKYAAWIISDEYKSGCFVPVGFKIFKILNAFLEPVDTIVVVRHNDRSANPMWSHRARKHNFFLRGFKYLFILRKKGRKGGSVE